MQQRSAATISFFLLAALVLIGAGLCGADEPAQDPERAAIEATVRDYIDGWYDGDVERMARALHPDLRKRSFRELPDGQRIVNDVTYTGMLAYTREGYGKRSKKEGQVNQVTVLDVSGTIASARSVSPEFVDYLHLAKVDGRWQIVNVLWELTPQASDAAAKK